MPGVTTTPWPLSWQGHWVSAPSDAPKAAGPRTAITPETPRHSFERVAFRREVDLTEIPVQARARLSADSRYVLRVNGHRVGAGPVRSQPDRWLYDSYDLTGALRAGRNHLEVLVTYYGRPNAIWQPARAGSGLGDRASMVFEGALDEQMVVSDATWQAVRLDQWTTLSELDSTARVPFEILDETRTERPAEPAEVRRVEHMGGLARSQPPVFPYGRLDPRPIGELSGEVVQPRAVAWRTTVGRVDDLSERAPIARLQQLGTALAPPSPVQATSTVLTCEPGTPGVIEIDMGRVVFGRVELGLHTDGATTASVALTERALRFDGSDDQGHIAGFIWHFDRTPATFESIERNGFRYAYVMVESETALSLTFEGLRVHEDLYQLAGPSSFESDDAALDTLYRAGRRTAELNSHDAFVDCPTREQRAWAGDAYVHAAVHLTSSDDWRLVRRSLQLAASPRPDGLLPMASSSDLEYIGNVTIPDWSLYWIHSLHDYWWYSADHLAVRDLLPTAARILRWYLDHVDPATGLIADTPGWNLVDWSAIFLDGRSSIINAMVGRALNEYAAMSDWLANRGEADWAREAHKSLASSFEVFWDPQRRVYIDHLGGAHPSGATSQLSNATALLAGFAPAGRHQDILAALTSPRTIYRNWIGADGAYSTRRRLQHLAGEQQIDWDTDTEVMRAEPFGSAMVLDALAELGASAALRTLIGQWDVFLRDGFDTFGECWGFGTPCHGWSAYPTAAIMRYLVGVRPTAPGFERACATPALDVLRHAHAVVPTPHGHLDLRWAPGLLTVQTPVLLELVLEGTPHSLEPGSHRLDLPTAGAPS